MLLDIHSHKAAPYPEGIINVAPDEFMSLEGQLYSVGIHPWNTSGGISEDLMKKLDEAAAHPQVVAIGECGVDVSKGGPMFRQLQVFRHHVELSERLRKPLVIHCVKGADIILGLKRDLQPTLPWIIHGFRGKPALAQQLLNAGLLLSYGPKFNPESVALTPAEALLAETDDSPESIAEVIAALSEATSRPLETEIASLLLKTIHPGR